jgi:hypothetical protein
LDSELFVKAHRFLNHIREFVLYIFPDYKDSGSGGHAMAHLVEALRYKPEGREVIRIFN